MGGEQIGWALDHDLAMTRIALSGLDDIVELTDLKDADVIHSVWDLPLLKLDQNLLSSKKIICHLCNDIGSRLEQLYINDVFRIVDMWVSIYKRANEVLNAMGMPAVYIPSAVDTRTFEGAKDKTTIQQFKRSYEIPDDRYIISNFMRDSLGSSLDYPKHQKGVELLLAILVRLANDGLPIHCLLAGPRRHWIRKKLRENNVPFTFVGKEVTNDDNHINILDQSLISMLYHVSNLHIVTSRWEGGPRAILEAGATRTKIISTPVGLAPDILERDCLYESFDQAINIVSADISLAALDHTVEKHYDRVTKNFVPDANIRRFRRLYDDLPISISDLHAKKSQRRYWLYSLWGKTKVYSKLAFHRLLRMGRTKQIKNNISILSPNPIRWKYLIDALGQISQIVEVNKLSARTDVCLCCTTSPLWDRVESLKKQKQVVVIHLVEEYLINRLCDEERRQFTKINSVAAFTVFNSQWLLEKLYGAGLKPKNPIIFKSAIDEKFFNRVGRAVFSQNRKLRLLAPYRLFNHQEKEDVFTAQIDHQIDLENFELDLHNPKPPNDGTIGAKWHIHSRKWAEILKQHDVYIAPDLDEIDCYTVLQALSCGLPVIYQSSAAWSEYVGFGGVSYASINELSDCLRRVADNYDYYQDLIVVKPTAQVVANYADLIAKIVTSRI